jgi:deferrochelatase/peroxidase EfeB
MRRPVARRSVGANPCRTATRTAFRAGEELETLRGGVPYGTPVEHGLHFVAFSAERARYDRMLARMFGVSGDGVRDRLTDFSRPVSGAYHFAPSLNALDAVAGPD